MGTFGRSLVLLVLFGTVPLVTAGPSQVDDAEQDVPNCSEILDQEIVVHGRVVVVVRYSPAMLVIAAVRTDDGTLVCTGNDTGYTVEELRPFAPVR